MAANRIGKSYCGAFELAVHVTGLYPDWWKGKRYKGPITAWACGVSSETTRDIIQHELLGSPDDPDQFGTGTIPLHLIVKTERKPGIPNAKSVILVKHVTGGNSTIHLKSYAMGVEIFQGKSVDCCWLDEEPSREIYSQCVTRTLDKRGMVYLTFTPERGMTETVSSFLNDLNPVNQLITRPGMMRQKSPLTPQQAGSLKRSGNGADTLIVCSGRTGDAAQRKTRGW